MTRVWLTLAAIAIPLIVAAVLLATVKPDGQLP